MIKDYNSYIKENKIYDYKCLIKKKDVLKSQVINSKKREDTTTNNDLDPYNEDIWDESVLKWNSNYFLKEFIESDYTKDDLPFIIRLNGIRYIGGHKYPIYLVNQDIIDTLDDEECIGYNIEYTGTIGSGELFHLIPIYQKEYIYEYDDSNPLKHFFTTDSKVYLRVKKEDWNKFVDVIYSLGKVVIRNIYHHLYNLEKNDSNLLFNEYDIAYLRISFFNDKILVSINQPNSKYLYEKNTKAVDFDAIMDHRAEYYDLTQ
jgi:hypothetical protein